MFEGFPYTNFHELNLDWIIKIAKDFLDQYTHIQETITEGEQQLTNKATELTALLDAWYSEHSQDIADELTAAVAELATVLQEKENAFVSFVEETTESVIESIPEDYTTLANTVNDIADNTVNLLKTNKTTPFGVNIIFTPVGHGIFSANGSSSATRIDYISDDIVLEAGTYRAGFYLTSGHAPINLQVRDFTGGSESGALLQTSTSGTFTLEQETPVRVRFQRSSSSITVNNVLLYPMLTKENDWPLGFVSFLTAYDSIAREYAFYNYDNGIVYKTNSSTNLNDFTEPGLYILDTATEYDNAPVQNVPRTLFVYKIMGGTYTVQMLLVPTEALFQTRQLSGSGPSWTTWTIRNQFGYISDTVSDLDDIVSDGWYVCSYATEYAHDPIGVNNDRILIQYTTSSGFYRTQIIISPTTGKMFVRLRKGNPGYWRPWFELTDKTRTVSYTYSPKSNAGQGENVGTTLKVMTYNVANYNNDTADYIPNDKLFNLLKMIYDVNPDIMMLQEDRTYIDLNNTQAAADYVFNPAYPNRIGTDGNTIRSKRNTSNSGTLVYTNGRYLKYTVLTIDDKTILLVSTHMVWNYNDTGSDSSESKQARNVQYIELMQWVTGQISLNDYTSGTPTPVPTHTHCIIGMDANTATNDDKTNLLTALNDASCIPVNGGKLGWFITNMDIGNALDNIVVSSNIIINKIQAYNDWYDKLYSDHVPVIAEITLK